MRSLSVCAWIFIRPSAAKPSTRAKSSDRSLEYMEEKVPKLEQNSCYERKMERYFEKGCHLALFLNPTPERATFD